MNNTRNKSLNEAIQTPELYDAFVSSIIQCLSNLSDADLLKITTLLDPQRALDARYPSSIIDFLETRTYRIAQNMTDRQFERFGEICERFEDNSYAELMQSGKRYRHIRQEPVSALDESRNMKRRGSLSEREQRLLRISKRLNEGKLNELNDETEQDYLIKRADNLHKSPSGAEKEDLDKLRSKRDNAIKNIIDSWNRKYGRKEKDYIFWMGVNPAKWVVNGSEDGSKDKNYFRVWKQVPNVCCGFADSDYSNAVTRSLTDEEKKAMKVADQLNQKWNEYFNKRSKKIQESLISEGKGFRNFIAGTALAASLFGGGANAHAERQGLPQNWGNDVETVAKNLQKAGMDNIKIKNDNLVVYTNKDGKVTFAKPGKGTYTETDIINSFVCQPFMAKQIESAVSKGKLDLNDYQTVANPNIYGTSLKQVLKKAENEGYGKDDFMLYTPQDSNVWYIMPNTDELQVIIDNPSQNTLNGINGI